MSKPRAQKPAAKKKTGAFAKEKGPRAKSMRLLLHNMQSPINIGMALRVAETYAAPVAVFDPKGVFAHPEKQKTISDFGCGALQRVGYVEVADDGEFIGALKAEGARLVATAITGAATPLDEFEFRDGDVIAIGNEYDGLPESIVAAADAVIHIRMADVWTPKPASHSAIDPTRTAPVANDGKPNLNAAMSAGIICYAAFLAREKQRRR